MIPIPFEGMNNTWNPNPEQVEATEGPIATTYAYCDGVTGMITVCFEVSDEELEEIISTRRIWMLQRGPDWKGVAIKSSSPIRYRSDAEEMFPEEIEDKDDTDDFR